MRALLTGFALGAAVALGVVRAFPAALAAERTVQGAGEAGTVNEKLSWRSAGGGSRESATVTRIVVKVPKSYGSLVHTSGGDDSSTLWFQDAEGTLRSVVLANGKAVYKVVSEGD